MKWILPALFICCTPLLCSSQTKKLPLYEYGITLLPDDYLYDTGTLADYTQVTMELHNGEMDTTALLRVRFSSGRMVSADRYEYDPADREKSRSPFAEKGIRKNGSRTSYIYDAEGKVVQVDNFRMIAADSREGAELEMSMTMDSLRIYLPAAYDQHHVKGQAGTQIALLKNEHELRKSLQARRIAQKIIPTGSELYTYNSDGNPVLSCDTGWQDTNYYFYTYYDDGYVHTQQVVAQRDTQTVITERVFAYDLQHRIREIATYRKEYNRRPLKATDTASIAGEYELQNKVLMQYDNAGHIETRMLLARTQQGIDTIGKTEYKNYGSDSTVQITTAYYYGGGKREKRAVTVYNTAGQPVEIRKYEPTQGGVGNQLVSRDILLYGVPDISEPVQMQNGRPVYTYIRQMPKFRADIHRYTTRKIRYPESVAKKEGTVTVRFAVTKEGDVEDVTIVQGMHPKLDAEVMRVIKRMRNLEPGTQNGRPVRMYYTLPVNIGRKI